MIIDESEYLAHYGILRKSGRYPWGSGRTENQRNKSFLDHVDELKRKGFSPVQICEAFDIRNEFGKTSTTALRAAISIARNEQRAALISNVEKLNAKGMSKVAIGRQLGIGESQVRALLASGVKERNDELVGTANMLKAHVADKPWGVDVGKGVSNHLGISDTKLNTAVAILREQGYQVHNVPITQLGTGEVTKVKALYPPGTQWGDAVRNKAQIRQIMEYSDDGGKTYNGITGNEPPIKINPKRVDVVYGSQGGSKADGVIYVRPGVPDVSMGKSQYAQVRIAVGNGHYLKGMAMYKDNLPEGIDLQFNTNKESTGNKLDALKKIEDDPDRPFGATVHPSTDIQGKPLINPRTGKISSAMNIVHEEGDWQGWSRTISTQMLSKQSPALARQQLDVTYQQKLKEFKELKSLTNPTIKKSLLEKFGDETDSSAVHLEAAALNTHQGWHAILPISSMSPNHVYAPGYQNGERVVLIRFPHAGTFEIPELTVNNNQPEAKRLLGSARDAVGIHHSVAERLSGADFDGDTVLVIPNGTGKIKSTAALEGLRDFNPRIQYKGYEGMKKMTDLEKGIQMGDISNLITDMTLKGASREHLVRAVRHSMVVIDAQKHELNYKQSAIDNGIAKLKEEYQGGPRAGAGTLISRATAKTEVPARKARPAGEGGAIDRETGKRVFVPTGETDFRTGKPRMIKVARLANTEDAHTLLSGDGVGTRMERLYADHSNKLKALANEARKESVNIPRAHYNSAAATTYAPQVKRLTAALKIAERNAPRERQAQIIGGAIYQMKREANPNMSQETKKKEKGRALDTGRRRAGAKKDRIVISDDEWQAIQAGAISDQKLRDILKHADIDTVRKLATPREPHLMTSAKTARAKSMLDAGATRAEVARALGVSLTTLDEATLPTE